MKKIGFIFACLVAVALVVLYFVSPGASGPSISLGSGSDAKFVRERSIDFLEDIKFKDFAKAASYHSREDRKDVKIAYLIERIFQVKPEFLDIVRYEITKVEIDRSGERAKVVTRTVVKVLNSGEVREPELVLYWHKDPVEGWTMKLESSLHDKRS